MILNVVNKEVCVGAIKVIGVASSSVFLIGDVSIVQLSSISDTPPESLTGPLVPFAPPGETV